MEERVGVTPFVPPEVGIVKPGVKPCGSDVCIRTEVESSVHTGMPIALWAGSGGRFRRRRYRHRSDKLCFVTLDRIERLLQIVGGGALRQQPHLHHIADRYMSQVIRGMGDDLLNFR